MGAWPTSGDDLPDEVAVEFKCNGIMMMRYVYTDYKDYHYGTPLQACQSYNPIDSRASTQTLVAQESSPPLRYTLRYSYGFDGQDDSQSSPNGPINFDLNLIDPSLRNPPPIHTPASTSNPPSNPNLTSNTNSTPAAAQPGPTGPSPTQPAAQAPVSFRQQITKGINNPAT